ncbi:MAG: hypothetical protein NZO16_03395 [Deltaproteobacteria bacterium]|nr:hypothetical protein [Deltaproteobacteria bacterium]
MLIQEIANHEPLEVSEFKRLLQTDLKAAVSHQAKLVENLDPYSVKRFNQFKETAHRVFEALGELNEGFIKLVNAEQGSHHQEGDVATHSLLVFWEVVEFLSAVEKNPDLLSALRKQTGLEWESIKFVLLVGALFHDITKPEYLVTEDGKTFFRGRLIEISRFLHHAETGAEKANSILRSSGVFADSKILEQEIKAIEFIIRYHMVYHCLNAEATNDLIQHGFKFPTYNDPKGIEEIVSSPYLPLLDRFCVCDRRATWPVKRERDDRIEVGSWPEADQDAIKSLCHKKTSAIKHNPLASTK